MIDFKNAKYVFESVMPKMIIYGRNGIGKSRFAMQAPNPIFFDLDKNLGQYKVITNKSDGINFPLDTFQQVLDFIALLINEPHDFKTIVIDSISSLNTLIENQIKKEKNINAISELDYGKGFDLAKMLWIQFKDKLEFLWTTRKMMIILIGHDKIADKPNLLYGSFNGYELSLANKSADVLRNWCSVMFYATDCLKFKEEIAGFGKVNKRISDAKKVLYTDGGTTFIAKNTYNLPLLIPFDNVEEAWNMFYSHIANHYQFNPTEIKGEKK